MSEKQPTLGETIKILSQAVERTVLYFDKIDSTNLPELLDAFRLLRENEEQLSTLHDALKQIKDKLSHETIPDIFESMGIDSIKAKGRNFILGTSFYASIPIDKREAGFQWLKDNRLGELITPTVNAKSLSSAVKAYIEASGQQPPEEAMSTHIKRNISVRKT